MCYANVLLCPWRSCALSMEATQQTARMMQRGLSAPRHCIALPLTFCIDARKAAGLMMRLSAATLSPKLSSLWKSLQQVLAALEIFQSRVYRRGNVTREAALSYPSLSCARLQWNLAISQPKQLCRPPETALLARCLRTQKKKKSFSGSFIFRGMHSTKKKEEKTLHLM